MEDPYNRHHIVTKSRDKEAEPPLASAIRETIRHLLPRLDLRELNEALGFIRARANYRNDNATPRACDVCGKTYRGPAVYCSLRCAERDA